MSHRYVRVTEEAYERVRKLAADEQRTIIAVASRLILADTEPAQASGPIGVETPPAFAGRHAAPTGIGHEFYPRKSNALRCEHCGRPAADHTRWRSGHD
jgi:hypothetical protein